MVKVKKINGGKVVMKKLIFLFLVLVLTVSASIVTWAQPTVYLIMATGGTAGTYYPYGGAICQLYNENIPNINATSQATGASVENMRLLNRGEVELALTQNDIADYAYKGIEFFQEPITNFSGIACLYPEVIQVMTSKDSEINSIADFAGKRISVGAPGSGNEANARQILGVFGYSYEDAEDLVPYYLSYAESAELYKDRLLDALILTTGVPSPAIMDVASMHDIKMVSIEKEMRDKIREEYPFFIEVTIPAGTYQGQEEDVETIAVLATLVVHNDLSEEVVYNLTKTLFEYQEDLIKGHAKGAELSLETAIEGFTIDIHPGAAKYYREVGLMK
jgi:uncharacterized protein